MYAFLLFALFLTLKLVGVIAWSWWLVTLPLWIIPLLLLLAFLLALGFLRLTQRQSKWAWGR